MSFFRKYWPWVLGAVVVVLAFFLLVFNTPLKTLLKDQDAAVTAFATVVIAVFTIVLAIVTHEQMKLTREALNADKRAYLFPFDLRLEWDLDIPTQTFSWRFRAQWKNGGDTPTHALKMYTECVNNNSELPKGFDFKSKRAAVYNGFIGPQQDITGTQAPPQPTPPISAADLLAVQRGTKFLYLWGWVTYHDVFADTPQHVTHFCWQIDVVGDPLTYDPSAEGVAVVDPGVLTFTWSLHSEGNCADGECGGLPRFY